MRLVIKSPKRVPVSQHSFTDSSGMTGTTPQNLMSRDANNNLTVNNIRYGVTGLEDENSLESVNECGCACHICSAGDHHPEEEYEEPETLGQDILAGLYSDPEAIFIVIEQEELEESVLDEKKRKKKKKKGDRCVRIAKRKYNRWPSAYACVPEHSSKALTRKGWKGVYELSVGEEILTHNLEKDILEFKPIINLHRYENVPTKVVKSGNNGFVFESTDNHKWVIKTPETKTAIERKYNKINGMALLTTEELLKHKHSKRIVVSAPYDDGESLMKKKIYKYGDNWIEYLLSCDSGQRQSWLFSAIVYDGNQQKIERLTETDNPETLEWKFDGKNDKQAFGFKQKDIMHRDAFLLSAFLNEGLVTWKKSPSRDIYSCHYSSNKRYKDTANLKIVQENVTDVWCPETENKTWVMQQVTDGQGIITITGNSGAVVKCRQGKIWKGLKESSEHVEYEIYETTLEEAALLLEKYKKIQQRSLKDWFSQNRGKGWIDCRTGKPCGRQKAGRGAKRKYPACRPTKAHCNKTGTRRKKGKAAISWKPKKDK